MRIVPLSDHAGEQLGRARQHLASTAADHAAWQQAHREAVDDLRRAQRAKPLWRRVLALPSDGERAARARVAQADRGVRHSAGGVDASRRRVEQQAAGVQGEDALVGGLSRLSDEWVLLRGYRNRRGEADHLLVGPLGVWAIEVKRRPVRVHIAGDQWTYEKLDRWGNVVETGWATDRSGRSWARQVTDVADDLAAWLARNRHRVPIRTAVMLMHERAQIGRHDQLTVDLVANHPDRLLAALATRQSPLDPEQRDEIVRLIERDHRFHRRRAQRS